MLSWFYGAINSYVVAIALLSVVVMAITTPLTLKSTQGMLAMQLLAPEMKRLRHEHRDDKQKLNEAMTKLYQKRKVNPMSSCLPIVAQMPIFLIMFRVLRGLVYRPSEANGSAAIAEATLRAIGRGDGAVGFIPRYPAIDSELYQSLFDKFEMRSFGIDLSTSAATAVGEDLGRGLMHVLLVVGLGGL